jgi:hypothetical protein
VQLACALPLQAALEARPEQICLQEFDALAPEDAAACTWVRAASGCGYAQLAQHAYAAHKQAVLADAGALDALAAALAASAQLHGEASALFAATQKRGVQLAPRTASALLHCLDAHGDHADALAVLQFLPSPDDADACALMRALGACELAVMPPAALALCDALCGTWAASSRAAELREALLVVCLVRGDSGRFTALLCDKPSQPLRPSVLEEISSRLEALQHTAEVAGAEQLALLWGAAADCALEASFAPDAAELPRLAAAFQQATAAAILAVAEPQEAPAAPEAAAEASPLQFNAAQLKQMNEAELRDLAAAMRVRDARKLPKKALRDALLKLAT